MDSYFALTFQLYIADGTVFTFSDEIPESIKAALKAEIALMAIFCNGNLEEGFTVYTRWSDWEEDMRLLSSRFPMLLFCLNYYGDDPYDLWEAYFWNGLMQMCHAEITFEPFDSNALAPDPSGKALVAQYSFQGDEKCLPTTFNLEDGIQ